MDEKDKEIRRLEKKVRELKEEVATLKIVFGRMESRYVTATEAAKAIKCLLAQVEEE